MTMVHPSIYPCMVAYRSLWSCFPFSKLLLKFLCGSQIILKLEWIEDCLKEGKILPCNLYLMEGMPLLPEDFVGGAASVNVGSKECGQEVDYSVKESTVLNINTNPGHVDPVPRDLEKDQIDASEGEPCFEFGSVCESSVMGRHISGIIPCMNKHLTDILREMWEIYESVLGDDWRALTFRKAAIQLEKLPYKILSMEDIKHISGIGKSMVANIKEILCTGKLQKLECLKADAKVSTLRHLASVWGIGPKLALKLYQEGHRSVSDLVKASGLSQMAHIGLKYYDDLTLRIPRDEVTAAEKYVQNEGETLCPGICISVAGSYRRGNLTCGDIDFLITHPDGHSHQGFLAKLVERLQSTGFITEGLHGTYQASKKVDTYMGVGRVPGYQHYRRIDIKVYSKEAYAFALVYFTGNDVLNRKMRYAAQRQGFKLNDQGLYLRYGGKKGLSCTESIPCENERELFRKIGLSFLEPCDRNL
ncbi:hypothetical protein KP509_23G039000 [Ceratopteris richardii]|uniref:DNA polymerase n=1 Tax=Ceratopteris richardii TaxID=49495 RepID=A0A8T2S0S5_CERRI|nr:hypothetical protein KP509_23G039000 [Ceratopteris richardii]